MAIPDSPIGNPIVVLREEFDDWAVLFDPDTADAVGISPVGVTIWKLMDGAHTMSEIVDVVSESFSEVPPTVGEEVEAFIQSLNARGLIGTIV